MARYPAMREEVRLAMTEGVSVSTETELGRYEIAQYPFSSLQAESQCGREVDRALLAGHLEPVPLSEYDQVRCVHPWTIVDQGGGKHRACQSYDVGLNRVTRTAPFALPSAWDVGRLLGPDSHFVKHDLRDGFWGVRINRASRNHFVLRHPITGMLVRCTACLLAGRTRRAFSAQSPRPSPRWFGGAARAAACTFSHTWTTS